MSKITLDNLSDNLKQYLNGLGLTSEQVIELINNVNGDLNELYTTDKSSLVGAINELFQNVDNGKNLIASSIGNPLINSNSTFNAMSDAILDMHADREEDRQKLIGILENNNVELSGNESMNTLLDLIDLSNLDLSKVVQISCGQQYTMALYNNGKLYATGLNTYGQLGTGNTKSVNAFTEVLDNVKHVSCGPYHACAVKNDGTLWATGQNNYGQLGLGNTTNKSTFTQVTTNINNDVDIVECGICFSYILKTDGTLWSCGSNYSGQLGLGTKDANGLEDRNTFTKVTTNVSNVKKIMCGGYLYFNSYKFGFIFMLKNDGTLWACGDQSQGQFGLGSVDTTEYTTFTRIATNVKDMYCGRVVSYIIKNDGTLWGAGYNSYGGLGDGTTTLKKSFTKISIDNVKQASCIGYFTGQSVVMENGCVLKEDGTIWMAGESGFTKINVNGNNDIKVFACGSDHILAIKDDNTLWAYKTNGSGELGLGHTQNTTSFTQVDETGALKSQVQTLTAEITMNKGNLASVLENKGVEVSPEDDMATLIGKVDGIKGGSLDIISATELPATGKENQICVITDTEPSNFIVTTDFADVQTTSNDVYIYQGTSIAKDLSFGTKVAITNNNITNNQYFCKVCQGNNRLASYIYQNNSWNQLTVSKILIYENRTFYNTSTFGTITSSQSTSGDFYWSSSTDITRPYNGSYYAQKTFNKKINFSLYNTIEVLAYRDSSNTTTLMIGQTDTTTTSSSSPSTIKSSSKSIASTTVVSNIYDISSWTDEGYLTLIGGKGGSFVITAIYIY